MSTGDELTKIEVTFDEDAVWPVPGPDGVAALVGQINHILAYKKSLRKENFSQKQRKRFIIDRIADPQLL